MATMVDEGLLGMLLGTLHTLLIKAADADGALGEVRGADAEGDED